MGREGRVRKRWDGKGREEKESEGGGKESEGGGKESEEVGRKAKRWEGKRRV